MSQIRLAVSLAVLPLLLALSLRADTIELKTGERIEGAFKQATSAGAVIEVGGQAITIPLEKVKAIYFGVVPTGAGPTAATQVPIAEGRRDSAPARPPSDEAGKAIRFAVLEKRFMPADPDSNEYQARIILKCSYENVSARDIRAFTGTVIFQDLFGREIHRVSVTISDPVKAGQQATWDGVANYNQFIEAQQRFRAAELRDMKVVWAPISIMFSDEAGPPKSAQEAPPGLDKLAANSAAAQASPAAAAALASVGHTRSQQELADLVAKGQASRCAVVTVPSGAEVYVDGNQIGVSPVAFVLLRQGDTPRKVAIKMAGYKTVEKALIPDGKTIPIGLELEKQ